MSKLTDTDKWIFRIGGIVLVIGALMVMVGNLIHPPTPIGDPEGVARTIAESESWIPIHLVIVIGLIFILGGLVAIYHSIKGGLAGALVRFGFVAAIAGVHVGLILVITDGVAAKYTAEVWATAPPAEEATALRLVSAEQAIEFSLVVLFNILFAGFTFILYGLAVAWSSVYPRWLGWIVLAPGLGSVPVGIYQAFLGESNSTIRVLTFILPTIITLWLAVMGVLVVRKGSSQTLSSSVY